MVGQLRFLDDTVDSQSFLTAGTQGGLNNGNVLSHRPGV